MHDASDASPSDQLTHIDDAGRAAMVDVSAKAVTERIAFAEGFVHMAPHVVAAIRENRVGKGEVLAVARVAGIQAAKRCADLIPLCHPLMLSKVAVDFSVRDDGVHVTALCKLAGQTGVEMEALTAVSVAALTIYDMCKAMDKGMTISEVRLLRKEGGKSGVWERTAQGDDT